MSGLNADGGEGGGCTLQPGVVIKPEIDEKIATELVSKLYGLKVKTIKEMNSYDDRNYTITVEEDHTNPHIETLWPHGYTLKVLNSMDSPKSHVDAEHEVQSILSQNGFACPVPVLTVFGKEYSREEICKLTDANWQENNPGEACPKNLVRLLTFVPGKILHSVPYTPRLQYNVGRYVGALEKTLRNFNHPGLANHQTVWDLSQSLRLRDFLHAVDDKANQNMIRDILDQFENEILPKMDHFQAGVIHGDYNEQNILVRPISSQGEEETTDHEVCGILDFGDCNFSRYVFEAAIAVMYVMVESKLVDPMDVGGHVLAGYLEEMPLNDDEFDSLKILVACRFAQSLVLGAYTYKLSSGNDYVIVTAERGWGILRRFWATPNTSIYKRWREVIDSYKTCKGKSIIQAV